MDADVASLDALDTQPLVRAYNKGYRAARHGKRFIAGLLAVAAQAQAAAAAENAALRAALERIEDACEIYVGAHRGGCLCGACVSWHAAHTALATPQSEHAARVQALIEATIELITGPHTPESYDRAIAKASNAVDAMKGGAGDG